MKISVEEIKNEITSNDFEKKIFDGIIDWNDEEKVTKEELNEKVSYIDDNLYEIIDEHFIDVYNDQLFQWYADDIKRIFYLESADYESHDIIQILQEGQAEYWAEEIGEILDKLHDYLDNWEDELDNDDDNDDNEDDEE